MGDYPDPGTRQLLARANALCEHSRFLCEQAKAISGRVQPLLREFTEYAPRNPSSADAPSSESRRSGECSTTLRQGEAADGQCTSTTASETANDGAQQRGGP